MDKQPVGQLPDLTQSNNDDEIMVITDSEHNQLKKEKISDFITDLTSTDENNAIVKGTDGKLFTKDFGDASNITEGTLPVDVLPESGVTADTYAYPSSVTVNAQGMVTAIEEGSPSGSNANTDLSNITEAGKEVILENSAGQPIGSLFWSFATADYVPEYALACDGTEYAASLFPGLWNDYLTAETPKLQTCTYEEYQQEITQYGACAKFAVDTTLNKFKVPTIKNTIYQGLSGTVPVVGNGKSLGLTDGTNNAGLFWSSGTNSGHTLSSKNSYGVDIATSSTWNSANLGSNKVVGVTSDATKSGLVAQLSSGDTSGITLKCFVVVANTSDNETAFDWSQWASSLAGKANKSDLSGEWVQAELVLLDASQVTSTPQIFDLSDYLPDNQHQYEIYVDLTVGDPSTNGIAINASPVNGIGLLFIRELDTAHHCITGILIVFPGEQKIQCYTSSYEQNRISLVINGYRKLGNAGG